MTDDALAEILTLTREVDVYETIRWRNSDGELHRVHGPAVIYRPGTQYWYQCGQLHRTDGPAALYFDGTWAWYLNNQRMSRDQWQAQLDGDTPV